MNPGDRLVFFTDGLLEARDRAGRFFRLEDSLGTLRQPDLQAAVDGLLSRLLAHTEASSTMTSHCCCWRRHPRRPGPRTILP